ncbi:MAG: tetratricopeptide repeat protein [Acidobacteriota bacterium]
MTTRRPLVASLAAVAIVCALAATQPLAAQEPSPTGTAFGEAMRQGQAALVAGDAGTAAERFTAAAALDPSSAAAHLGLAEAERLRGALYEALAAARRAQQAAPEPIEPSIAVASLQVELGAVRDALETLEAIRSRAPDDARAYLLSALVLRDAEQLEAATELLHQAEARGVGGAPLASELGLLLLAGGKAADAEAVAARHLSVDGDAGGPNLVMGLALAAQPARRAEATPYLEKALAGGAPDPGRIHLELGALAFDGCSEAAIGHFRTARELRPDLAQAHYRLGSALAACGRTDEAATHLTRFREMAGDADARDHAARAAGADLNVVRTLAANGRPLAALESLAEIESRSPDDARVARLRARLELALQRDADALASARRADALLPGQVESLLLVGLAASRVGELVDAASALERALAVDPRRADVHALLAAVEADRGRFEPAAEHFQTALRLGAEGPELRLAYARVLERLGRSDDARRQLELRAVLGGP